jgi:hypothetical protein
MAQFAQFAKSINSPTTPKNFTGCGVNGLLFALIGYAVNGLFSDSEGNTWSSGNTPVLGAGGGSLRAFWVFNPKVSSVQTFNSLATQFSMIVVGFANVGFLGVSENTPGPVQQAGPLSSFDLFISGYGGGTVVGASVNSPFAGTEISNDFSVGVNFSTALSYFVRPFVGTEDPTWSRVSGDGACSLTVFQPGPIPVALSRTEIPLGVSTILLANTLYATPPRAVNIEYKTTGAAVLEGSLDGSTFITLDTAIGADTRIVNGIVTPFIRPSANITVIFRRMRTKL